MKVLMCFIVTLICFFSQTCFVCTYLLEIFPEQLLTWQMNSVTWLTGLLNWKFFLVFEHI